MSGPERALADAAAHVIEVARAMGVRDVEVAASWQRDAQLELVDGAERRALEGESWSVAIRVLGRGLGFAATSDLSLEALEATLAQARAEAALTHPTRLEGFAAQPSSEPRDTLDPRATGVLGPRLHAAARALERSTLDGAGVRAVRPASVGEGIETWLVSTPRSGPVLSRASRAWAMAVALAGPTDDEVVGEAQDVAWALDDVELTRVASVARARALAKLGAERLPTGPRAVVLAPAVVAELLEALVGGLTGDVYDRGGSFLAGRLGAPVFGPGITLFDDPHQPRLAGSAWIDAEGVPTQPRALVREGRIVALLDDAKTAADGGRTGGGCAQRGSEFSRPRPGPSNLVLATGTASRDALLAGALLVESLSGGHLVDGATDAVSVGVVGALFDAAGRRGPSVAGVSLAAPWTALLGPGARASREAEAHGAVIAPWLRVEDVSIGGGDDEDDDPEGDA